jgi:hypothetical protein
MKRRVEIGAARVNGFAPPLLHRASARSRPLENKIARRTAEVLDGLVEDEVEEAVLAAEDADDCRGEEVKQRV